MKTLHCRYAGYDRYAVIKGINEEEVLKGAAVHAREVHRMEPTPEQAEKLKVLFREEEMPEKA